MNYKCKIEYTYRDHLIRYVIHYVSVMSIFRVDVILSVPNEDKDIIETYRQEIENYKENLNIHLSNSADILPMDTHHNLGMSHTLVFLTDDINDFHSKFKTFSAAIDSISAKLWEAYE